MDVLDAFIQDLTKGAAATEGFLRNGRMRVEVVRDNHGHETKVAALDETTDVDAIRSHAAGMATSQTANRGALLGGAAGLLLRKNHGAAVGGALGGALGGAAMAPEGLRLRGALGGGLGAGVGTLGGGSLGSYLGRRVGGTPGAWLGRAGGALLGSSLGGYIGVRQLTDLKDVPAYYSAGSDDAATMFMDKQAFLGVLGSLAGPALARAGAGALARGIGGQAAAGIAKKVVPHMAKGLGGIATEAVGSIAGGALGAKLMPGTKQPPSAPAPSLRTASVLSTIAGMALPYATQAAFRILAPNAMPAINNAFDAPFRGLKTLGANAITAVRGPATPAQALVQALHAAPSPATALPPVSRALAGVVPFRRGV